MRRGWLRVTTASGAEYSDGGADPLLTLDPTVLRAEPGGQASLSAKVRNPGRLVESFRLDVVGLDPGWWEVHPPELPVYPGAEESAVVVFKPPQAGEVPAAPLPFGVRAVSTLTAQRSVVEEGDLEVGRVFDLQAAITPVTASARWRARFRLRLTNWGNAPVRLRLAAADRDERLGFLITPDVVGVPVGGTVTAKVRARPRRPFLRGSPAHLPFQVIGEPVGAEERPAIRTAAPDPSRVVVDAAVLQRPVLSRALVALAGLVVVGLVAGVALLLRAGSVAGAGLADIAPDPPAKVAARALTAALVEVSWQAADRATSYQVQRVDQPTGAVKELKVAPAEQTAIELPISEGQQQVCYRVAAMRGDLLGKASQPKCTKLPAVSLDPPTGVKLAGSELSWQGDEKNQHVVLLDGKDAVATVGAGTLSTKVDVPPGEHCFQVVARRGDRSSSPSEDACGKGAGGATDGATATPSASASTPPATPGDPGTGGDLTEWVAQLALSQEGNEFLLNQRVEQLQSAGVKAQIIKAADYPQLGYTGLTLVIVVSGFATESDAQQFCDANARKVGAACEPVQPGPKE